jgi:hypothetical protein
MAPLISVLLSLFATFLVSGLAIPNPGPNDITNVLETIPPAATGLCEAVLDYQSESLNITKLQVGISVDDIKHQFSFLRLYMNTLAT